MLVSPYGKPQTTLIFLLGLLATGLCLAFNQWIAAGLALAAMAVLLAFFRDPDRTIPQEKGLVVSPADGRVSSIHDLDHYAPFNGPARCIRIFLSVLDVHVNRSPVHGRVIRITHTPGQHLNALKAESAELNESVTIEMHHPIHDHPVAVVRQVAGAIARRIVCGAKEGQILQRGERFGLIKFGSTTEVYLPHPEQVEVKVKKGQYVWGGSTALAQLPKNGFGAMPVSPSPQKPD